MKRFLLIPIAFALVSCMTGNDSGGAKTAVEPGIYHAAFQDECNDYVVEYWFKNDTNLIATFFGYSLRKPGCEDTAAVLLKDSNVTMLNVFTRRYRLDGSALIMDKELGMSVSLSRTRNLKNREDVDHLKAAVDSFDKTGSDLSTQIDTLPIRNVDAGSFDLYMQFGWDPETGLKAMDWRRFSKIGKRIF